MSVSKYTPSGFGLIDFDSDDWHQQEWNNWTLVDALIQSALGDVALPVVGGTANAITLTYTPAKVITNGSTIVFIPTASPTGAVTVATDGGAAKALQVLGAAITAGDIVAGDIVKAVYDGTLFQVQYPIRKYGRITVNIGASGCTVDAIADDITVHSNLDVGISLLSPNNKKASIAFGDPENAKAGLIQFDHATDVYSISIDGNVIATLGATGLKFNQGYVALNLNGANDFWIKEISNDFVRIGSSGATNGIGINILTGDVTLYNALLVTGVTTVKDDIVRFGKGIHPFFNNAAMVGGEIFFQAIGADPTANPGDMVFEW